MAYRGETYPFEELLALRGSENFAAKIRPAWQRRQYERCQMQIDRMASILDEAGPDVVLIIGDDQFEWFSEFVQPSFAVFCGKQVENLAMTDEEIRAHRADGRLIDPLGYHPPSNAIYPVAQSLAEHIISQAILEGFDVSACMRQPKADHGLINLGHAYGFVYRQLLRDRPIPLVPVLVNTFYPPNQPTPQRCIHFGRAMGRAIKSWPTKASVAVCASGGLSHFVIDEQFDETILTALKNADYTALMSQPDAMFRSGTSEIKNWLIAAGVLAETDLAMTVLDYVPCYRTEAGTGNAMAFAVWR
ncbi:MAG TPA: hypothetical protein VGH13_02895 [Xanthobacteraceae bacterium]